MYECMGVWLCMAVWLYIQRVHTRGCCMAMYGDVWAGTTFHKWIKSAVTLPVRAHRPHRHCIEVSTHTGYASVSDSRPSRMLPATTFSLSGNPYMLYGTHTAHTRAHVAIQQDSSHTSSCRNRTGLRILTNRTQRIHSVRIRRKMTEFVPTHERDRRTRLSALADATARTACVRHLHADTRARAHTRARASLPTDSRRWCRLTVATRPAEPCRCPARCRHPPSDLSTADALSIRPARADARAEPER